MLTNNNLVLEKSERGKIQRIHRCTNGYGISLVKGGVSCDLWELTVLKGVKETGEGGRLCYDTSITDDVVRFGNDDEANAFILDALDKLESIIPIELQATEAPAGEAVTSD